MINTTTAATTIAPKRDKPHLFRTASPAMNVSNERAGPYQLWVCGRGVSRTLARPASDGSKRPEPRRS
jgi:hypothetical protein